jgi:hypothetical protein
MEWPTLTSPAQYHKKAKNPKVKKSEKIGQAATTNVSGDKHQFKLEFLTLNAGLQSVSNKHTTRKQTVLTLFHMNC